MHVYVRLSLFVFPVLAACASEPLYPVPTNPAVIDYVAANQLESTPRILKTNGDGWMYLNNRYVLYRGQLDHYLLEFRHNCREIRNSHWIPADYIHDHRYMRAGVDTIRGCVVERMYLISGAQREELRSLGEAPGARYE